MMVDVQEKSRYSRQIAMFGEKGQERLKNARVLVTGVGGLGSLIASYLGLAGIGFIRIVGIDQVDNSNLNRQMLILTADVGRGKTASASEKLADVCPSCRVDALHWIIDVRRTPVYTMCGNEGGGAA